MEQVVPGGCPLEWDLGPSVMVQWVQVLLGRQALVSVSLTGSVEDQSGILARTLATAAYKTHRVTN